MLGSAAGDETTSALAASRRHAEGQDLPVPEPGDSGGRRVLVFHETAF
jgi:hypothetical protein